MWRITMVDHAHLTIDPCGCMDVMSAIQKMCPNVLELMGLLIPASHVCAPINNNGRRECYDHPYPEQFNWTSLSVFKLSTLIWLIHQLTILMLTMGSQTQMFTCLKIIPRACLAVYRQLDMMRSDHSSVSDEELSHRTQLLVIG
jgi:hypothetical protein